MIKKNYICLAVIALTASIAGKSTNVSRIISSYAAQGDVIIDPNKQSQGLTVYRWATPVLRLTENLFPKDRIESKETITVENDINSHRIDIKFNDGNFYFDQEENDFSHKEIKLSDIATNRYGQKIRDGLVFLHAIVTNYGSVTPVTFSTLLPDVSYQDHAFEMLAEGNWEKEEDLWKPVFRSLLANEKLQELRSLNGITRITKLNPEEFSVSIRMYEFNSGSVNKGSKNPRVGQELLPKGDKFSLPERASVLVKWILRYTGDPSNLLDFLPEGTFPDKCQAPWFVKEKHAWQNKMVLENTTLLGKCFDTKEKEVYPLNNSWPVTSRIHAYKFINGIGGGSYITPRLAPISSYKVTNSKKRRNIQLFYHEVPAHIDISHSVETNRGDLRFARNEEIRERERARIEAEKIEQVQRIVKEREELRRSYLNLKVVDKVSFRKADGLFLTLVGDLFIKFEKWEKEAEIKFYEFKARIKGE